jgi:hypothetical protein
VADGYVDSQYSHAPLPSLKAKDRSQTVDIGRPRRKFFLIHCIIPMSGHEKSKSESEPLFFPVVLQKLE